ncbi:MAG: S-methyl-5-thioribose-1-phosphate isomerase [Candidatus Schekmanbacteria bacterium]|nr:S-methyl-5-thioribose-1-phosphate isomerase [Candidatus Schekmanbacteria bacterium]
MIVHDRHYQTVWLEGDAVVLIDQLALPHSFAIKRCATYRETAEAIRGMLVRGAGAIGAAAGYGLAQAALQAPDAGWPTFARALAEARQHLEATRPTAQNLFYATRRVFLAATGAAPEVAAARHSARLAAQQIAAEDAAACASIGAAGAHLIGEGATVLTHCNAGWLAFVDWGTALAPVYAAVRRGARPFVLVDETRPRCQGSSLTAWELAHEGVPHAVIADNAAGYYMQRGEVQVVIVGADRIAANGDVANKIGTYEKAVVARDNGVPFYVAAPLTTIDPACSSGRDIPIEERPAEELTTMAGLTESGAVQRIRLTHSPARNPAFDVTPARLITGLITPHGIFPATAAGVAAALTAGAATP